jgi:hypothetical protein
MAAGFSAARSGETMKRRHAIDDMIMVGTEPAKSIVPVRQQGKWNKRLRKFNPDYYVRKQRKTVMMLNFRHMKESTIEAIRRNFPADCSMWFAGESLYVQTPDGKGKYRFSTFDSTGNCSDRWPIYT